MMTQHNTPEVAGTRYLKHLLIVLAVTVTLNVDVSNAQDCGLVPTDGNSNVPQVEIGDRDDTDTVTVTCLDGYEAKTDGASSFDRECSTDKWDPSITAEYCEDTDECTPTICGTGYCINVAGGYVCVCDGVSLYDSADNDCDGYQCGCPPVDPNAKRTEAGLDKTDEVTYTCFTGFGVGGSTTSSQHTLDCDGTTGSWGTIDTYCEDINECDTDGSCGTGYDSSCRNTYGSYICVCDYPGAASTSTGKCVESACGSVLIDPHARLLEHSFEYDEELDYECEKGYETVAGASGFTYVCEGGDWRTDREPFCYDVNECEDTDICGEAGECRNVPGSYICVCPFSEIYNPVTNACEGLRCGCPVHDPNAYVPEADGVPDEVITYACEEGFWYDSSNPPSDRYNVECEGGDWQHPNNYCQDINECSESFDNCDTNAKCINTAGSYICRCNHGYTGRGHSGNCALIECPVLPVLLNADITPGSPDTPVSMDENQFGDMFIYTCEAGYVLWQENLPWESPQGYLEYHDFDLNADEFTITCTATGEYSPHPLPHCVPESCFNPGVIANAKRDPGSDFTGTIKFQCDAGFMRADGGIGPFTLTCVPGTGWTGATTCINIDECDEDTDNCDTNAECIDEHGSHHCRCYQGYTGDGYTGNCERVECDVLPNIPHASPTLTLPAAPEYEDKVVYDCEVGYEVSIVGGLNLDLQNLYEFTSTSFMVECLHTGRWSSWPMPYCAPVSCGDPGLIGNATRTGGKFTYDMDVTYECNEGYRLKSQVADPQEFSITCRSDGDWDSLQECVDIDECTERTDLCNRASNADCINVPGAYICRCRDGFTGDGRTCTRISCDPLPIIPHTVATPFTLPNPHFEDEVTYQCTTGYQVWLYGVPSYLLGYYSYTTVTSFTVTCTASGLWNPWPHPICVQVKCEPLPALPNAQPTSNVPTAPVYEDEVFYTCVKGHHVLQQTPYTSFLPVYYGYSQKSSFSVTCSEKGQWDPFPIPVCVPVYCGDPGIIMYATRSEGEFTYGKAVDYTCIDGFQPKDRDLGTTGFSRTCQEDGSWSKDTQCVDIDECTEDPDMCGRGVNYCLNTKGSYICSCVPWYIKSPEDTSCVDWAGLASFPVYKPCEIIKSLRLCINGDCALDDGGQAVCKCHQGWRGIGCDVRIFGTALILAIIGLLFVALLLLFTCFYCIYHATHRHRHDHPPPVYFPPLPAKPRTPDPPRKPHVPPPPPPPPQTMRLPKPPPRFPAWGSDGAGRGKRRGLRRTPDKPYGSFPFR